MTVYLSKLSHRQGGPRIGALMAAKINLQVAMLSVVCLLLPINAMAMQATETFSIDDVKQGSLVFENAQGEIALTLPMKTKVSMQVSGWTNRVSVRHEFKNNSSDWVNGEYLFPLPNEAAVDQLKLHIGDRVIEGQVQPKAKAKAIFEQAKSQGKKASLLEQKRPNIFSAKVANLAPNQMLVVELTYQETIDYRDGEFSLRFPMVIAPRYAPKRTRSGYLKDSAYLKDNAKALSDEIDSSIKPAEYVQYYTQQRHSFDIHEQVVAPDLMLEEATVAEQRNNNRVTLKVAFDSAMPIEQIRSPYHQINVRIAEDSGVLVSLQREAIANKDFVLSWRPIQGSEPMAAVFAQVGKTHASNIYSDPAGSNIAPLNQALSNSTVEPSSVGAAQPLTTSDKYALVMLMPPQGATEHDSAIPRELILVIDTSGSMSGDAIIQAKTALKYALAGLRPQDRFNILQFNSVVDKWSDVAMPATAVNLGRAQNYINHLQANGGTEMSIALYAALSSDTAIISKNGDILDSENLYSENLGSESLSKEDWLRQVLFITDGAVANEAMLFEQIEAQLGESRLFTIGIGSAPNAHFMQRAAQLGRGTYTYIGKLDEVNQKVVNLLEKIEKPQVTDVDLRFSDGSVPDYWPVRIPDLYAHDPLLVAVKLPSYVSHDLLIQGQLAGQFWQRRLSVNGTKVAKGLDLVWARKQIAALELSKQRANRERIEKQITAIAMNFHIMSAYTSLVAVDLTPSKPQGIDAKSAKVMQHLPDGWRGSLQNQLQTLPQTGTNSYVFIIFGSVLLFLAVLYRLSFSRGAFSRACLKDLE
ncbi:marine proteobacterial sortase target protein [Shewanella schlegeliana]|uniref:Marine proteobacterial sortase target protein n=1 Tax=Shewanella schlegeliana TaxID=190308 RepID=A0ABS1SV12_9GAMM|nr:marine proteobacterial sortase target protein [Shewanella schlegeliana]MBL4911870.1 marine proteobacterial sortase target protein [Shewanella schlegeliana]MCL1110177.1 marine proteobacterial sortase target protein [Shewanella schlegeliana]GIU27084.1 marine proteobacterial sortase target protein [Shewanella schlegeliana]